MRRFLAPALVGLGVFLVLIGALLRFYVYPQVAVAPIDQLSVTSLEAEDATVLDTATLAPITTDLSIKARTAGDVKASEKADDGTLVWVTTQVIKSADGVERLKSTERVAFDEFTAQAVNCCDTWTEDTQGVKEQVKRKGLVYKFPFDTEKKTYQLWDDSLGDTVDAKFKGEDEIDGLDVYKFEVSVPKTVVGDRPDTPASLVGADAEGNVTVDTTYQLERTIWVEPVTGAIIDDERDQTQTFEYAGAPGVTTLSGTIQYTDAQVKSNVEEYQDLSGLLNGVKTTYPLIAVVLGLLALGAGLLLGRRRTEA